MEELEKILKDIKSIKIQGANEIALAGVKAFLLDPTKGNAKRILDTRPTEPLLKNAIKRLLKSKDPEYESIKFIWYLKSSENKTSEFGADLIKNGMNIFTHCHSTTVMEILKKAKKQGKKFVVYNLEVAPLYQGRKTAKELAKQGIKVIHFPDLAMDHAIKNCDLVLFGVDAFLDKGVINKNGTSVIAKIAKEYDIPSYACGYSLKYTPDIRIEIRKGREVWDEREKNIVVINPAFELVNKENITGVISEFGILDYPKFIKNAKKNKLNIK
jgi:translation initiation factor 2B subunit (eIF-2B alpha/beta/delta family)